MRSGNKFNDRSADMAEQQPRDLNTDRNNSRTSTEEAKHRAESTLGRNESTSVRHGGAGKMGMDRATADEQRRRASVSSQDREQRDGPNEEGDLEKSSGHP
jgi:hypothetical protein